MLKVSCAEFAEKYQNLAELRKSFGGNYALGKKDAVKRKEALRLGREVMKAAREMQTAIRLRFFEQYHPDWPLDRELAAGDYSVVKEIKVGTNVMDFRVFGDNLVCETVTTELHGGPEGLVSRHQNKLLSYDKKDGYSKPTEIFSVDNCLIRWIGGKTAAVIDDYQGNLRILRRTAAGGWEIKNVPEKIFVKNNINSCLDFFSDNSAVCLTKDNELVFLVIDPSGEIRISRKIELKEDKGFPLIGINTSPDGAVLVQRDDELTGHTDFFIDLVNIDESGNYAQQKKYLETVAPLNVESYFKKRVELDELPWEIEYDNEKYRVKQVLPSGRIVAEQRRGLGASTTYIGGIFSLNKKTGKFIRHVDYGFTALHSARELADRTIMIGGSGVARAIFFRKGGGFSKTVHFQCDYGKYQIPENNKVYTAVKDRIEIYGKS